MTATYPAVIGVNDVNELTTGPVKIKLDGDIKTYMMQRLFRNQ